MKTYILDIEGNDSDLSPRIVKRYLEIKDLVNKLKKINRLYLETNNPKYLVTSYHLSKNILNHLAKLYGELSNESISEIGFVDWGKLWKNLTERVTGGAKWIAEQASNLQKSIVRNIAWIRKEATNRFNAFITQAQSALGGLWNTLTVNIPDFVNRFKAWLWKTKFGVDLSPVYNLINSKKREIKQFLILYSRLKKESSSGTLELKRKELLEKYAWVYNFLTHPIVKPILFPLIGLRESELGEIGLAPATVAILIAIAVVISFFGFASAINAMANWEKEKRKTEQTKILRQEVNSIDEQINKLTKEYVNAVQSGDYDRARKLLELIQTLQKRKQKLLSQPKPITEQVFDFFENVGIKRSHAKLILYGIGGLILLLIIYKIYKVITE